MSLQSWFPIPRSSHFSLANLPFGIISHASSSEPHPAIAIGEHALDLSVFVSSKGFRSLKPDLLDQSAFHQPTLNAFAAQGRQIHRIVRQYLQEVLQLSTPFPEILRDDLELQKKCLILLEDVKMHLPMQIGDYTDFFVGKHHAFNTGALWRGPQHALQPNYMHLPVAYHGRASSVVVSGTPIHRPHGQFLENPMAASKAPIFSPSQRLDFELELGAFVCKDNPMGSPVPVNEASQNVFGVVLMNDWSARDIQLWEMAPLGPFNSKNFGTSISPWVVLMDALEPFRSPGIPNDTEILPYLREQQKNNTFDIKLEIDISPTFSKSPTTISRSNGRNLLFSFSQMLAHHTVGGCPMHVGDLVGSGTVSGMDTSAGGCLLEITKNGKDPVNLSGGKTRRFLEDGDTVTLRGYCGTEETGLVGFGECNGTIMPALTLAHL
ncbi:MAG: hypothetical protein Q9160_007488 [Pyrenula sp. 1 TL-2023]